MEKENLNEAKKPALQQGDVMRCSISIDGCDDSTSFEMEMTEQEYQFMERVCKQSTESSRYGCMPTMTVCKNIA